MSKLQIFFVAILIGLSAFTHLYRIDKTFIFNGDEARDVLIAKKMIDTKKPVLLGPQTSVGNMYLGPLYYYFMVPSLLLSNMQPVGPAVMIALFGIMTTILIFIWGRQHFGFGGGLIAGLAYSLIPIMVHFSRSSWNPNLVPFFSVVLLFAYDWRGWRGWLLLGIAAGALFQLHYVALSAVSLTGLAMIYRDHATIRSFSIIHSLLLAILGFVIVTSPFWLFEARHEWVDTRAFMTYLITRQHDTAYPGNYFTRIVSNFNLVAHDIVGSGPIALYPLPIALALAISALLLLFPLLTSTIYLWYLLIGTLVLVSFIKEPIYSHYVAHLFPVLCLMFGALVTKVNRYVSYGVILVLIYLLFWSLPILQYNLVEITSSQIERASEVASYIVAHAGGRPYNVVNTQGTLITLVEYFLSLSKSPPQNSLQSLIFDVCQGAPCPQDDETTTLLFLTGPTHPALGDYLGHPQYIEFNIPRVMIQNERVSYDSWVATIILKP